MALQLFGGEPAKALAQAFKTGIFRPTLVAIPIIAGTARTVLTMMDDWPHRNPPSGEILPGESISEALTRILQERVGAKNVLLVRHLGTCNRMVDTTRKVRSQDGRCWSGKSLHCVTVQILDPRGAWDAPSDPRIRHLNVIPTDKCLHAMQTSGSSRVKIAIMQKALPDMPKEAMARA